MVRSRHLFKQKRWVNIRNEELQAFSRTYTAPHCGPQLVISHAEDDDPKTPDSCSSRLIAQRCRWNLHRVAIIITIHAGCLLTEVTRQPHYSVKLHDWNLKALRAAVHCLNIDATIVSLHNMIQHVVHHEGNLERHWIANICLSNDTNLMLATRMIINMGRKCSSILPM